MPHPLAFPGILSLLLTRVSQAEGRDLAIGGLTHPFSLSSAIEWQLTQSIYNGCPVMPIFLLGDVLCPFVMCYLPNCSYSLVMVPSIDQSLGNHCD
jgi:hypothetical protein